MCRIVAWARTTFPLGQASKEATPEWGQVWTTNPCSPDDLSKLRAAGGMGKWHGEVAWRLRRAAREGWIAMIRPLGGFRGYCLT